jgi:hypothetical protein
MQINQFLRRVSFAIPIALVALLLASPTGAQTNYYSAYYSLNSVTPSYIEASGVLPLNGDDSWLQVSLPFPFTFYGVTYPQFHPIYVSTNGYINFLAGNSVYSNQCLPSGATPNGAIYAFWDDLYVDASASMHTEVLGTAPNRRFVIEWRNVHFYGDSNRRLSFELVLSETGEITIQYRDVNDDFRERGGDATIGVETTDGVYAYQFSCNRPTMGSAEFPLGSTTFAIQFSHASTVAADIKPGGCPNTINVGSKGVLPVAILGTDNLNVEDIDPQSVTLAGVSPLRWSHEDVGTPYMPLTGKTEANQCNALGADGYTDLALKFDTQAVAAALGTVNDGDVLVLHLTGTLRNGTPVSGEDVVTIIQKGK